MGYSAWGHKELDTTERLHFYFLSLVVWWLKLHFHCKGRGFDPWLGN